jgi:hypothetical protein
VGTPHPGGASPPPDPPPSPPESQCSPDRVPESAGNFPGRGFLVLVLDNNFQLPSSVENFCKSGSSHPIGESCIEVIPRTALLEERLSRDQGVFPCIWRLGVLTSELFPMKCGGVCLESVGGDSTIFCRSNFGGGSKVSGGFLPE